MLLWPIGEALACQASFRWVRFPLVAPTRVPVRTCSTLRTGLIHMECR